MSDTPSDLLERAIGIGRRWMINSSLEEWFPFTAQELASLKADNAQLKAERDALRVALERVVNLADRNNVPLNEYFAPSIEQARAVLSATAQKQDKP